jgi:HEAT repeat protein
MPVVVVEQKERKEIGTLVEILLNGSTYGRLQAAEALGKAGAPAVDPLVEALTDPGTCARWNVAMALAKVGSPAVEALIETVKTEDDSVRNPAVWALAEIGDPRAVEAMIAAMKSGRSECCRALSAAALLKLGHPDGVAAVEEELKSADENFRGVVYEALEGS